MKEKILKITIDILMLITLIVTLATMQDLMIHTIAGFVFVFFVIIHICLYIKWLVAITKNFNKVKRKIKIQYIINIALTVMWLISIITAILILCGMESMRDAHVITGAVACVLTIIHIFQHRKRIITLLKRKKKSL